MIRRRRRFRAALPYLLLVGLAACAAAAVPRAGVARPHPYVITREEIESLSGAGDAYDVVRLLRPQWLRQRGTTSFGAEPPLWVYVDGLRLGTVSALRELPVALLVRLEYLDGVTATQRWGLDHGNGAIVVTTQRTP